MHLLTREAVEVYWSRLRPDGLLVIHASNRHLDLSAVVRGLAQQSGQQSVRFISTGDSNDGTVTARWVIMTNNARFLENRTVRVESTDWSPQELKPLHWSDDFGSLWSAVVKSRIPGKWDSAPNGGRFVTDQANLVSTDDEEHIETVCRALYSDTHGNKSISVMTAESMASTGVVGASLKQFSTAI
jgi:hypothetical protein